MHTCSGFCYACNKLVALAMKRTASMAIPMASAAGASLFAATSSKRDRLARTVVGGLAGAVVDAVFDAFTPVAQEWVCGDCGCSKVSQAA